MPEPIDTTAGTGAGAAPTASILRNRNFILLWCAYTISALGDHLSEVALLDMQNVLDREDSTRIGAIMLFLFFLPFLVFSPVMGWLADRLPRKRIMIAADIVRLGLLLSVYPLIRAFLPDVEAFADQVRAGAVGSAATAPYGPWVYCLPLLFVGLFAALFSPARAAMLPTLVRTNQIVRANGLMNAMGPIAAIASFLLGAYIVKTYGAARCFQIDGLTFLVSAAFIVFIVAPSRGRVAASPEPRRLRDGFSYCRTHRRTLELISFTVLFWAAASVVRSTIPALVQGGDLADIANYNAAIALGLLSGALLVGVLGEALKSEMAISWSFVGVGLAIYGLALSVALDWSFGYRAVCLFSAGLFGSGILVGANALLQKTVPDYIRGRVIGVKDLASMAGLILATGVLGLPHWPQIDRYVPLILGLTGVAMLVAGMRITRVRLRRGRYSVPVTFWKNAIGLHARIVTRVRRDGLCTVPVDGPVIVAANHNSTIDPFLLVAMSPNRYLSFMVAREYMGIPIISTLVRLAECIPVNRTGVDVASVKAALRHLADGKAIGIFPHGKIVPYDDWETIQEGVGMLALRSGATVIPAYVSGTYYRGNIFTPFVRPQRAVVRFGKPLDMSRWAGRPKNRAAYREATAYIVAEIRKLKREG